MIPDDFDCKIIRRLKQVEYPANDIVHPVLYRQNVQVKPFEPAFKVQVAGAYPQGFKDFVVLVSAGRIPDSPNTQDKSYNQKNQ